MLTHKYNHDFNIYLLASCHPITSSNSDTHEDVEGGGRSRLVDPLLYRRGSVWVAETATACVPDKALS